LAVESVRRELQLSTSGADDTRRLAATIATALRVGDIVSLTGELGAGKTCFVQGAAAALGVTDRVTSPTFLLRRDYQGRVPVVHLDVYRLDTLREAGELGFDEVGRSVTFIEWGDAMQPLLPGSHLEVELTVPPQATIGPTGDETRRIVVRPHGADWKRRIVGLAVDCAQWRTDGGPPRLDALEL
jgi:tRNA threonylcarbamoyladenosine biosynthesis protein TsaE